MKLKYVLVLLIAVVFLILTVASPAMAGSKSRHRWQGIAIGFGAALLGQALLDQPQAPTEYEGSVYRSKGHRPHGRYRHRHQQHGHWEYRKIWVAPTYKKIWNAGHYNRRGRWVKGHWIEIKVSDGFWRKERIWVAGR